MKTKLLNITDKNIKQTIVLSQTCEKIYEKNIPDKLLEKRFCNGFNIVFTGNISPAQSFITLIQAAKKLSDDGIDNINWIIVGDGMSKKWLIKEVEKAGLADCFFFEGHRPVEDMSKYTNIADAFIGCLVKSDLLEATIPAKVISYIASGKPVLLAMDGEVQTLINDTIKCGFASPAGDFDVLYKNILKLYNLPEKNRITMGKLAKDYYFKNLERNLIYTRMYNFIFDKK